MKPVASTLFLLVTFSVLAQGMDNQQTNYVKELRAKLKEFERNDECHLGTSASKGAKVQKAAAENCGQAMFVYKTLEHNDNAKNCPNARKAACHACGKSKLHCGFHCDPTPSEIAAAQRQGKQPPAYVCKHLKDLMGSGWFGK